MSAEELDQEESDDTLFEHHRVVVDPGQHVKRIDKFLVDRLERTSRSKIQNACDNGFVKVNGVVTKSSYKIKPNDVISIEMPYPVHDKEVIPENIPLEILYEDEDLIVLNKPMNMVVHPGFGNYSGTLVNALVYHFQNLPKRSDQHPGLVHRLDKHTTGVMVIAKTEYALAHLAKQFYDRTIERRYVALAWGDVEKDGTVVGHVGRTVQDRKVFAVFEDGSRGKHAVTHYKVLKSWQYVSLIECKLETGRTHQIRAHMKYLGHPIFSDETYGGAQILRGQSVGKYKQFVENCFKIIPRQALHAKTLGFIHPTTKKKLFFETEWPEDFKRVIEKWESYVSGNNNED